MKAIKRHKTLTAFVISLVVVVILGAIPSIDVGGVAELMGLGWSVYGFAWLIWEYPKWRKRRAEGTKE